MSATRRKLVTGLLGAGFFGRTLPAWGQSRMTMSSWLPPAHHLTVLLRQWGDDVRKATEGRVDALMLAQHPSAPPGTFDAVKDGLVDVSYVPSSLTPARHAVTFMPELPGFGSSAESKSVAFSRVYWRHLHKAGEYRGVRLLGVFTHGPGQLLTKKPVSSIGDLQGLKLRTGGGVAEAVARALGASAFVKSAGESYELLSSGVADGTLFPIESVASFKLHTVIGQATIFPGGLYSTSFAVFMNEDRWSKLDRRDQDAIDGLSGERLARLAGKSWDEADRRGYEVLRSAGVAVVNAPAPLVDEVNRRCQPIVGDWVQKVAAKGIDGKAMLAEFREELRKLEAGR